jgi:DNA-binding response OmpR family regulator
MNGQSIRVLLVEDDPIDAELAGRALAANANPRFVLECVSTLALAIKRICDQTFSVVLLDLELPDSLRAETLPRFQEACREDLPVIVLADLVDDNLALEVLARGAQDCLDKNDFTPGLLSRSIHSALLRQRVAQQRKTASDLLEEKNRRSSQLCDTAQLSHEFRTPNRVDVHPMPTVLVVDDDREVSHCLSVRLRSAGFQVLSASDGDEGVLTARSHHPDAIVLDVRMPKKDGLAALRELRDHPTTKNTPVIMLSASIHDQQRALKLGAGFFVRKPYNADEVLSAIEASFRENAP